MRTLLRSGLRRAAFATAMLAMAAGGASAQTDAENTLRLETSQGPVVIDLREDIAPQHAERLKMLAREGFYDGVIFHRVIDGFMAQTGDPTGTGTGGSKYEDLQAEFSSEPFERGTVGMARSASPNSANSQFFIMFAPAPHLNGQYTVVGEVVEGMENVDKLARGEPPANPDRIVKATVGGEDAQ